MFRYNAITPPITGWLEIELDKDIIDRLWKYADKASVSVKDTLAGNISESLDLKDEDNWFRDNVLRGCVNEYAKNYPHGFNKQDHLAPRKSYDLEGFWINYQKKHEFNPSHDHGGVFSFVIWLKIPTKSKEQHNLDFLKGMEGASASDFEMAYIDTTGQIRSYPYLMDPEMEGKMLFFPSSFKHCVYPFYECDEDRISISGNLYYC
jgi:hypothetical protein|tara:strand:+ start:197 stop:814 length:618 start_codon:yes stop_codon:yes gene_type:complete